MFRFDRYTTRVSGTVSSTMLIFDRFVRTGQLLKIILLLPFHSSILKPDLDLSFREAQHVGDLNATSARQVAVVVEFLLQFQRLVPGVRLPRSLLFEVDFCGTQWDRGGGGDTV